MCMRIPLAVQSEPRINSLVDVEIPAYKVDFHIISTVKLTTEYAIGFFDSYLPK